MSQLDKVTVGDFRTALRHDLANSPIPNHFFQGVYAPWEPMPRWLETLLEQYGG